jgi:hypothetical protein
MNKKQQQIEEKIRQTKAAIMELGPTRPGSLSQQARARGDLYYQMSFNHDGKGHTEYVRPEHVIQVKQELRNYRKLKKLLQQWMNWELRLSKLKRS